MKVKFIKARRLYVPTFGIFNPDQTIEVNKKRGKQMVESGYFKEIKEIKKKEYSGTDTEPDKKGSEQ